MNFVSLFFFDSLLVRFVIFLDPFAGIVPLKHWGGETFDVVISCHDFTITVMNRLVDQWGCFVPFCGGSRLLALFLVCHGLAECVCECSRWDEALLDLEAIVTLVPAVKIATNKVRGWTRWSDSIVLSTQWREKHLMKLKVVVINFRQFTSFQKKEKPLNSIIPNSYFLFYP